MKKFDGAKSEPHLKELAGKITEDVLSLTNGVFHSGADFRKFATERKIQLSGNIKDSVRQIIASDKNLDEATRKQFAQSGVLTVDSYNVLIDQVRRDYGSTEVSTFSLDQFAPEQEVMAQTIVNATYGPNTGMIDARPLGTPFKAKAKLPLTQTSFNPMYFGNIETFDEQELLFLRDFGSQDISSRGIQQSLVYNELKLLVSLYQRKFDIISQGFTAGQYQYVTDQISYQTVYGINGNGQQFTPIGAKWATATGPGGAYVMNPLANPLNDIWYALTSYGPWKQYLQAVMGSGKFILNPNTMNWILTNPNTQSQAAFQVALSTDFDRYDLEAYMRCYFPASNIEIVVDYTMRMNDDLTTTYVYPDGYISVMFDSRSHGGAIGDFVYTTNVQAGGWQNSQTGIYTFIADLTSPQSYGGAQGNPHINIGVGANMGLRIPNPNVVLSMYVI